MSENVIKILDDLGKRFGIAIDWSSQNVMPYLQSLMLRFTTYEIITSAIWIVVSFAVILGLLLGIRQINKYEAFVLKEERTWPDWLDHKYLIIIIFIIIIVIAFLILVSSVLDIVTCCTIPEKAIFEYLNSTLSSIH